MCTENVQNFLSSLRSSISLTIIIFGSERLGDPGQAGDPGYASLVHIPIIPPLHSQVARRCRPRLLCEPFQNL